jgi:hypothetical protein
MRQVVTLGLAMFGCPSPLRSIDTREESEMTDDPISIVRKAYQAYVANDRAMIESVIADDFHFTSPLDNRIDRRTYFDRCWKNSEMITGIDFNQSGQRRRAGVRNL